MTDYLSIYNRHLFIHNTRVNTYIVEMLGCFHNVRSSLVLVVLHPALTKEFPVEKNIPRMKNTPIFSACVGVFVHMYACALTRMGWPWRPGGPAVWVAQLSPRQSDSQTAQSYSPPWPDAHTQTHTVKSIITTKAQIISIGHTVISRSKRLFVWKRLLSFFSHHLCDLFQGDLVVSRVLLSQSSTYKKRKVIKVYYLTVLSTIAMTLTDTNGFHLSKSVHLDPVHWVFISLFVQFGLQALLASAPQVDNL